MRQKIIKFLTELSGTYRIPEDSFDRVINDTANYLMRNLPAYEIDFEKVKDAVFDKYRPKAKVFPEPYFIKECMQYGKIYKYDPSNDEGCLVTIQTPKALYAFEMCGFGKDIEEVKKEIAKNYGNSQVRTYPKGSVLIGKEVFTP